MLKTLDRGLHALRTIGQHVDGLLTAELAKELDVDRAIAYRIVSTLEQHRMVVRQPDGRLVLGSAALRGLDPIVHVSSGSVLYPTDDPVREVRESLGFLRAALAG